MDDVVLCGYVRRHLVDKRAPCTLRPVIVHPLLAEPTDEQTRLLDVIYKGRELAGSPNFRGADTGGVQRVGGLGRWPIFQYVEAILYQEHKLDARTTLAECPRIAGEGGS